LRDVDEASKIHGVYETSRTRGRTADFTKSEQLALTSHRPSATSVLVSIGPRDDRLMYRKYGDNLTVYNAVTSPTERKLSTNDKICSLGEEQCSYANLSSSNVLPLERNRDDESHIEQIFISVPKINQHVNLSSPIERTNQKRRSSNLGIFYSPRNSVEIERQFQNHCDDRNRLLYVI
uniref:Uncharacterized protein n=1 Tax=Ascaris lumbricoides TaxID=6252 RepID=A0A0M3IHM5_ASCLU